MGSQKAYNSITLVVMAAGLGARYGGHKQIDGFGPAGELLMEYSVYDALQAGFDKVVFVIQPEMEAELRALCGDRISRYVDVSYVYQSFDDLPAFYSVPEGRVRPLGTVHALLSARRAVSGPFAVLNADDFYGSDAFKTMFGAVSKLPAAGKATMVGYRLRNTLSANGSVSRGLCEEDHGQLVKVRETYGVRMLPDGTIVYDENAEGAGGVPSPEKLVSMNFWGFTPWIFDAAELYFEAFLRGLCQDDIASECLLPIMVNDLLCSGALSVSVLETDAQWCGVTYPEDKAVVQERLLGLVARETYPRKLFV